MPWCFIFCPGLQRVRKLLQKYTMPQCRVYKPRPQTVTGWGWDHCLWNFCTVSQKLSLNLLKNCKLHLLFASDLRFFLYFCSSFLARCKLGQKTFSDGTLVQQTLYQHIPLTSFVLVRNKFARWNSSPCLKLFHGQYLVIKNGSNYVSYINRISHYLAIIITN